jgi:DNA-binding CsgD family transcriptional regulator
MSEGNNEELSLTDEEKRQIKKLGRAGKEILKMALGDDEKVRLTDDEKRQIEKLSRAGETAVEIADYLHVSPSAVRKHLRKAAKDRAGKLSGAVFMISLALLLLTGFSVGGFFFVLAATSLASGLGEGNMGSGLQGAVWLVAIGLIISGLFSLPLLLILIGLSSLFGLFSWGRQSRRGVEDKAERRREMREGLREAGRAIRDGFRGRWDEEYEKRKNDERRYRDEDEGYQEYEKPKRGAMRLSDDGELIDIVDDEDEESLDMRHN